MLIRKFLHSCLLVEKGADRILFDPGKFSFVEGGARPGDLQGLKAVIVTHSHPDHMDDDALRVIMENNPEAILMGNAGVASALKDKGLSVEEFGEGTRSIGEFHVQAYEARHAPIVSGQIPPNTAYLVDGRLLNPGDSYAYSLDALRGTEVLALPVMAPWTTELDTVGFAARMSAKRILPIHDGYVKDYFLRMRYDNFESHFRSQEVRFERLEKVGDAVEI